MPLKRSRFMPDFRRVHEPLQRLGVDTATLYPALGIRESEFVEQDSVSIPAYLELLQRAAEHHRRPFLGLELAQLRNLSDLGALGYMLRNAPDFGRTLDIIDSYVDLVTPGARTAVIQSGDSCIWTYALPGYSAALCRQEVELSLYEFVYVTRELLALGHWRPQEVFFQHDAPRGLAPLRRAFGNRLIFKHYCNGVRFPRDFLSRSISNADPQLLRVLQAQVQHSIDRLKQSNDLLARLNNMLSSRMGKADISADELASQMGMSRRTLHRRLEALGTSFSEQRDIVVLQLAKQTLGTTSVSVTELAQQLGYADSAAFDRAFKRLTGLTPLAYRRAHGHRMPSARSHRRT